MSKTSGKSTASASSKGQVGSPKLLAGGNPQIPKGYGQASVDAYIAAMPEWKHDVGLRLDALITQAVPKVRKAVKWNSPMYGLQDDLWFVSFHCFDKYIKFAFFRGTSLTPQPPVSSKTADTRYLHVSPSEPLDEAQFTAWIKQASRLPGEKM